MNSKRKISQKRSILVGALVLSQAFYLTPLPVSAQDATVRLAGQAVITNVSTAGALTGAQRAETIQQNLDNALVASKDRSPNAVNIEYVKGLPVITLGGYQVITVDSASAKTAGTTPALLAQRWADALKGALQDQASVSSYVGHLTGEYQGGSSSPAPAPAPAPQQQAYQGSAYQSGYPQGAPQTPSYGAGANVGYNQGAPYNGGANAGYPQGGAPYNGGANYNPGYNPPPPGYRHGRVVYAPAGTMLNATLSTSISSQVARPGDLIQANISQAVNLGDSQIPIGSVLMGQVTDSKAGGRLGLAGKLGVQFNRLRTPDGTETPISASLVGGIGNYDENDNGVMAGETWKRKTVQAGVRGAAGAGLGAALGTAVGAIAGGGRGAGRGAWSGTAIGGGVGVASSLALRKGRDVTIPSGTPIQVRLDAPVSIAGGGPGPYVGAY
ncbi:MAG: hypothetical protein H6677_15420 [Candidatus Obscuribacterales bacterium]|nr:hypothetical protein [Candidatus Obscuribacterales bacterium]